MLNREKQRYVFIDALRGLACLGVLFHHLLHCTVMEVALRRILPAWICIVSDYGARGVQVFFIISGFVIAHSLAAFQPSPKTVGMFCLRRQLRLDPVYWASMLLALICAEAERLAPSLQRPPFPSIECIGGNALYLQNLLRIPQVVGVGWTLCIEIQFYLTFIVMLSIASALTRRRAAGTTGASAVLVSLLTFACLFQVLGTADKRTFLPFWPYFGAGVMCYYAVSCRLPKWTFLSFALGFLLFSIRQNDSSMWFGFATSVVLFAVGWGGCLAKWSGGAVIQYFGRISYSLYLVHVTILSEILRGGYKLTHENRFSALIWMVVAAIASIVVAHILYSTVERPSMKLASSLRKSPPLRLVTEPSISPATLEHAGNVAV